MSTLLNQLRRRSSVMYALLFATVFAGIGAGVLSLTHAATTGSLAVSPATATLPLGGNFTVTVVEDSQDTPVNAVEADLSYDQTKLQFVSITPGNAFGIEAVNTGGNGAVSLTRGTITPVTGQQTVATITFKAIAAGSATVSFTDSSLLLDSVDNADILAGTTGGTYVISDTTAPTVPTGLASSDQTAISITLGWSAATDNVGVTGYNVYRNGTKIGTATTTSYTDNAGLTPSTSYSYTVSAYDAAGNTSAQSAAASFSTKADSTAPSVPANLTAGTRTLNSIDFSWSAATDNAGVAGYNVYRNGNKIGTSATTNFTNTGLTPGTNYTFTVSAYDAAGNTSAQSVPLATSTLADTAAPSVPTALTMTGSTLSSVALSWSAATDNVGVTGYNVYRNGTKIGASSTATYTDNTVAINTDYSYTVAAYDAAGNVSAPSSVLSISLRPKPGDVDNSGYVDITDLSILLSNYSQSGASRSDGDLNDDDTVNIYDLSILLSYWHT